VNPTRREGALTRCVSQPLEILTPGVAKAQLMSMVPPD
jgi:hypothetical protein